MPRMPENELDRVPEWYREPRLPCVAQAALITLHALPEFPLSRVAQASLSDPLWMGPNWNIFLGKSD